MGDRRMESSMRNDELSSKTTLKVKVSKPRLLVAVVPILASATVGLAPAGASSCAIESYHSAALTAAEETMVVTWDMYFDLQDHHQDYGSRGMLRSGGHYGGDRDIAESYGWVWNDTTCTFEIPVVPEPAPAPGPVSTADSMDEILAATDYRLADADILRLYQAFFERLPDVNGTKYWIGVARSGPELNEIAGWFADSDEFALTYGGTTDREFLKIVYANVLGRSYDLDGFEYWIGQMQAGLSRGGVVRWVAANDEFITAYPFAPTS